MLSAETSGTESRRTLVAGTPVQESAVDQASAWVGLTKPLPTGGALELGLESDFNRTECLRPPCEAALRRRRARAVIGA